MEFQNKEEIIEEGFSEEEFRAMGTGIWFDFI